LLKFLLRRTLQSAVALLALVTVVFFLARLTGDPVDLFLPLEATEEARARVAAQYGFDQPIPVQYVRYLGGVLSLDFGPSIFQGRPAIDPVLEAFPVTLMLALVTMSIAAALAILVGAVAAYRPDGVFDRIASVVTLIGASTPDFWLAIVAILFFSVSLGLLPTSGTGGIAFWVLPVGVLLTRPLGVLTQVVRSSFLNALSAPYVRTARAKGASTRRVIFVHALRNALLPVITVAGDLLAGFLNGAVVVETIFGWPGIGHLMISSIRQRDFAVVQAAILVTAVAVFVMNILIDFAYARLDPRVSVRQAKQ
jgi:peptide/nickel transport system permease protein